MTVNTPSREARIEARVADNIRYGLSESAARRAATGFVDAQDAHAKQEAWDANLAGEQAKIDAAERARQEGELAAGERALTERLLAQGDEAARIEGEREEAREAERESNLCYV